MDTSVEVAAVVAAEGDTSDVEGDAGTDVWEEDLADVDSDKVDWDDALVEGASLGVVDDDERDERLQVT